MTISYLFPIILIISCAAPIDYFGNSINLNKENIYLTELRNEDKDKFLLIFKGKFNSKQYGDDLINRKKSLERYIKLIKKYYGYTESKIVDEEYFGVIAPRYYVTIKFN